MDFGGSSGPIRRWAGLWENRLARAEASEGKWPDEQSLHVADWGCQASCTRSLSLTVHIYNTGFCPSQVWARSLKETPEVKSGHTNPWFPDQ